jgi:hypothetical protein
MTKVNKMHKVYVQALQIHDRSFFTTSDVLSEEKVFLEFKVLHYQTQSSLVRLNTDNDLCIVVQVTPLDTKGWGISVSRPMKPTINSPKAARQQIHEA